MVGSISSRLSSLRWKATLAGKQLQQISAPELRCWLKSMLHTSRRLRRFVPSLTPCLLHTGACKHGCLIHYSALQTKDSLEAHLTEHLRLSGVYWGLTALYLMGQLHIVDGAAILDWVRSVSTAQRRFVSCRKSRIDCTYSLQVMKCQHASGGFGGSERNDPHILYTLSALQILALYDRLDLVNADQVVLCELSLSIPVHGPCSRD